MASSVEPRNDPADRAWRFLKDGHPDEAIHFLESHPELSKNAHYLGTLAYLHYLQRNYERASEYAEQSLHLNPKYRRALTVLGEIALKEHNPEAAYSYFHDAYLDADDNVYIAVRLASVCLTLDKPDEAVAVLEKTWEKNPKNIQLLETLRYAYLCAGNRDQSQKIFDIITDISQRNSEAARAFLPRKFEMMDPGEAVTMLTQLLNMKHYRENEELRLVTASKLMQLQRFDEALPHLEYVLQKRPRSEQIIMKTARCYLLAGKPEKTLALLQESPFIQYGEAWYETYIEALFRADQKQEAMDMCLQVLMNCPRNRKLRKILNTLRKQGIKPSPDAL